MKNLENVKVSMGERFVLQMLDKKYKYLARDSEGDLHVYEEKPKKGHFCWFYSNGFCGFSEFNHHFQFIKWEDDEPWLIKDIINKCGVKFE